VDHSLTESAPRGRMKLPKKKNGIPQEVRSTLLKREIKGEKLKSNNENHTKIKKVIKKRVWNQKLERPVTLTSEMARYDPGVGE